MKKLIRITDDTDFLTLEKGDVLVVEEEDEFGYWATDGYEDIYVEKNECESIREDD
ncbi:hypothetical protein [Bacillus subtilis]|uniref:hypothetical protein n=1 Tax=Bacillus subtilis TaxID=1423 RepID=UPI0013E8F984|nr:hypothetical protein [Bacillus subtilis]CAF1803180.1 hypothetical protein NRS6141_00796 [Bacillus subtilis]CAF1876841.1 hypothetical protein NRS6204_00316 [Bacillus subtilis]CAF1878864.1 hypothetical protein NRS6205_00316 [Bacillus subtilis]